MSHKININDPKAWSELDWDEPQASELLKKSDGKVNIARSNRLRSSDPKLRKKISDGLKGRTVSWGDKIGEKILGIKRSDETKEKIRQSALKKPPVSKETSEKISQAIRGKKRSKETCEKLSQMRLGKKWNEETKKALSQKKRQKSKAFVTPEGLFECRAAAIEWYNKKFNSKNGKDYFSYRKTRYPDQYYLISREEYLKLIK
jgi:hypothetical protein